MTTSLAYTRLKQERHASQLAYFEECDERCETGQELFLALLEKWPTRLPKIVVKRLGRDSMKGFLAVKEIKRQIQIKTLYSSEDYIDFLTEEGVEDYFGKAVQVFNLIQTLQNVTSISVFFTPPSEFFKEDDESPETYKFTIQNNGNIFDFHNMDFFSELVKVFSLCLKGSAGINIRQRLELKVQRPNEQGVMAWQHQEKIYGVHLSMGEVGLLDEKEMKWAYNTDSQTGETLPMDAGTSFGNLKAINKIKKIVD